MYKFNNSCVYTFLYYIFNSLYIFVFTPHLLWQCKRMFPMPIKPFWIELNANRLHTNPHTFTNHYINHICQNYVDNNNSYCWIQLVDASNKKIAVSISKEFHLQGMGKEIHPLFFQLGMWFIVTTRPVHHFICTNRK